MIIYIFYVKILMEYSDNFLSISQKVVATALMTVSVLLIAKSLHNMQSIPGDKC